MLKFLLDVPIKACIESDPAAGAILAHQDWVRQKCGSGLAIATAYGAVRACAAAQGNEKSVSHFSGTLWGDGDTLEK